MYTFGQDVVLIITFSIIIGLGILIGWVKWGNDYVEVEVLVERVIDNPPEPELAQFSIASTPESQEELVLNVRKILEELTGSNDLYNEQGTDNLFEQCKIDINTCWGEREFERIERDDLQKEIDELKTKIQNMISPTECYTYQECNQ